MERSSRIVSLLARVVALLLLACGGGATVSEPADLQMQFAKAVVDASVTLPCETSRALTL